MYRVILTKSFERSFKKLDRSTQKIIHKWMELHLLDCENPRAYGKALTADWHGYWRYRVGAYRMIVEIKDVELVIIAIIVSHRREIYRS